MFEVLPLDPADLAVASDADVVDAIAGWARVATQAEAFKVAAIGEWQHRNCADPVGPRWACDDWDNAAAQIGSALNISPGRASGQMDLAVALRDRFPKLGRRFMAGQVPVWMVSMVVWRTALVVDGQALAELDSAFTDAIDGWGVLSMAKLEHAIDMWIDKYDPDAVRRVRDRIRGRSFTVGKRDDATGTTSVFGRLSAVDAALVKERLTAMVRGVCDDDPRTTAQRRADAVGALAAGSLVLTCRCDNPDCAAATIDDGRASSLTIHAVADKASLDAPPDPGFNGPEPEHAVPTTAEARAKPAVKLTPGVIAGTRGAILPASLLAELIAHGAKVRFVGGPDTITGSDGYRPSVALAEFVRARDLTCRAPGCDRPAVHAEIDHTRPWPTGPTHPSNLKCYCKFHHLIKTFWDGWSDMQLPDGTVQVTTPTGRTYVTKPFSRLLFPGWETTTAPSPGHDEPLPPRVPGREVMMPSRRYPREQARRYRITAERRLNALQRERDVQAAAGAAARKAKRKAEERPAQPADYSGYFAHPRDHQPDYGDDPPPF